MNWTSDDYEFMARAMYLAGQGVYTSDPNPRVGCVLVKDNKIIGEGSHIKTGKEHAEINAIKQAENQATDATCYVTLEPCVHTGKTPPCTEGLISAGISKVIASIVDPNPIVNGKGLNTLKENGIQVSTGLLESEALEINKGYIKRHRQGLPYIRCKLAISLDGRTALQSGESKWITSEQARIDVQKLRALSSAIMTGIGTVKSDDPKLTVRNVDMLGRIPLRVIIDRQLEISFDAELFNHTGKVVIFSLNENQNKHDRLREKDVDVIIVKDNDEFLTSVMKILVDRYQVNNVLVESGALLSGALLKSNLIDEFIIYQAPVLLGDAARPMVAIGDINDMSNKVAMQLKDVRQIGDDLRMCYQMKNANK